MKKLNFFIFIGLALLSIASCGEKDDKDSDKLSPPTLITPANNQYVSSYYVSFDWSDVLNATEYELQVSSNPNFSSIIYSEANANSSIGIYGPDYLNNTTTYYWRVRALAPGFENSNFSEIYVLNFNGYAGNDFNLLSPSNNSVNIPLTQTFTSETYQNASLYTFYFESQNDNFSETSSTNSVNVSLNSNQVYSWFVKATDINNNDFYSPTWSFTTINPNCSICGLYSGTYSGNMQIALTGTDTTFSNLPSSADVTYLSGNNYNIAIDISALLGAPAGTLVPDFNGSLSGNTLTVTNETYVYSGIANIIVNGTMSFPTSNSSNGTFTISGDAIGSISFSGTK